MGAAMCIRCIQDGIELPSGNVFMFPALNLHLSPSPSRFLHQNDPVLPRGILELALTSYYPSHGHSNQYKLNIHDPCVPGAGRRLAARKFPPTSLVVGDLDPLLDDSVDFYTRLSFLKVPSSLKIYSRALARLPHLRRPGAGGAEGDRRDVRARPKLHPAALTSSREGVG